MVGEPNLHGYLHTSRRDTGGSDSLPWPSARTGYNAYTNISGKNPLGSWLRGLMSTGGGAGSYDAALASGPGGVEQFGSLGAGEGAGAGSGVMGSLGPIGAIAAAVMASKGAEQSLNQSGSPLGKVMSSFNAPSGAQIMKQPELGVTTALGVPFLNGLLIDDDAATASPEWSGLMGGGK